MGWVRHEACGMHGRDEECIYNSVLFEVIISVLVALRKDSYVFISNSDI
jgi:hypothetical protein